MPATPENGTILAFDYGTRIIGIAVGNRFTASARALTTVANGDWTRLDRLIAEWQPERLVVGLPLALDGSEQAMSRAARAFAAELGARCQRRVDLVDERHTSAEAARRFAERRARGAVKRKDAADIDAVAAEIILESWLAQPPA